MGERSRIEWTFHTMNFWWGCNKVSLGCKSCYLDPIMRRFGLEPFQGPIRTKDWSGPRKWDKKAREAGERHRVFTCSMSDFFHPGADNWRPEAWDVIRSCKNLDWLILTKRPELIAERLPKDWGEGWPHVWLGVTVESNAYVERADVLRDTPAAVRFISYEPALGPVPHLDLTDMDWLIVGGESGPNQRTMELDWLLSIVKRCRREGVPCFVKQDSAFRDGQQGRIPDDVWAVKEFPRPRVETPKTGLLF